MRLSRKQAALMRDMMRFGVIKRAPHMAPGTGAFLPSREEPREAWVAPDVWEHMERRIAEAEAEPVEVAS